jgi:hypothetical protein
MKKMLLIVGLSLAVTAAYADGSINIDVNDNIPVANWNLNGNDIISYQFNNKTNKAMRFSLKADAKSTDQLAIYCLDKNVPTAPTQEILPGATFECKATDVIKMSGQLSKVLSGQYSIALVE